MLDLLSILKNTTLLNYIEFLDTPLADLNSEPTICIIIMNLDIHKLLLTGTLNTHSCFSLMTATFKTLVTSMFRNTRGFQSLRSIIACEHLLLIHE